MTCQVDNSSGSSSSSIVLLLVLLRRSLRVLAIFFLLLVTTVEEEDDDDGADEDEGTPLPPAKVVGLLEPSPPPPLFRSRVIVRFFNAPICLLCVVYCVCYIIALVLPCRVDVGGSLWILELFVVAVRCGAGGFVVFIADDCGGWGMIVSFINPNESSRMTDRRPQKSYPRNVDGQILVISTSLKPPRWSVERRPHSITIGTQPRSYLCHVRSCIHTKPNSKTFLDLTQLMERFDRILFHVPTQYSVTTIQSRNHWTEHLPLREYTLKIGGAPLPL
jgi:hypothetical protein